MQFLKDGVQTVDGLTLFIAKNEGNANDGIKINPFLFHSKFIRSSLMNTNFVSNMHP